MRWKVGAVTQMPAPSHHGQVNAGATALHFHRQDVDIGVRDGVYRLLMQNPRQGRHLIPNFSRQLKLELVRMRHHACFHGLQN